MNKSNSNIFSYAGLLTVALLGCKFISFVLDFLMAHYIGANEKTDILIASDSFITLFTSVITSPVTAAFIPIFSKIDNENRKEDTNKFVFTARISLFLFAMGISIIIVLFFQPISSILYPGFDNNQRAVLRILVLIQLPNVVFLLINSVNSSLLRYFDRYTIPELLNKVGILLGIIVVIIMREDIQIHYIAICYVIGNATSIIIQEAVLKRKGINYFGKIKFDLNFKKFIAFSTSFLLASMVRDLNLAVDKGVASLLGTGSMTILSYANKLTIAEVGLISTAISTVMLSQASKYYSNNKIDQYKNTVVSSFNFVISLLLPLVVLTILCRYQIISILFGHGRFSEENIIIAGDTMACYAIGVVGFGIQDVITRAMHAAQVARFTVIFSVILTIINIVLNLILYRPFGTIGIALASSFAVLIISVPLLYFFHKRFVSLKGSGILRENIKTIFAAFVSVIPCVIINPLMGVKQDFIYLLINILIYCSLYMVISLLINSQLSIEIKILFSKRIENINKRRKN